MPESEAVRAFVAAVEQEALDLLGRAPAWTVSGSRAGQLEPLAREERAARRERREAGDRLGRKRALADRLEGASGEVWLRERLSATPWGVPKEVWRARRDRERDVIDAEDALLAARLEAYERYLADLRALAPDSAVADAPPDVTAEQVDQLWRERRRAVEERAQLLARDLRVRAVLCQALRDRAGDIPAIARAAAPALHALGDEGLRVPVLCAALAIHAAREGPGGLGCEP